MGKDRFPGGAWHMYLSVVPGILNDWKPSGDIMGEHEYRRDTTRPEWYPH